MTGPLPAPGDTGAGVLALEAQGARSRVDNLMESTAGSVQSPGVHARIGQSHGHDHKQLGGDHHRLSVPVARCAA